MPKTTEQRFFDKIPSTLKDSQCWIWQGAVKSSGYGNFYVPPNKYVGAHVFMYEHYYAESVPKGMQVQHSCHNKLCVNPLHLSIGTPKRNNQDSATALLFMHGDKNYNARLTELQALTAIYMASYGMCIADIATSLETPYSVVLRIIKEQRWTHLWRIYPDLPRTKDYALPNKTIKITTHDFDFMVLCARKGLSIHKIATIMTVAHATIQKHIGHLLL